MSEKMLTGSSKLYHNYVRVHLVFNDTIEFLSLLYLYQPLGSTTINIASDFDQTPWYVRSISPGTPGAYLLYDPDMVSREPLIHNFDWDVNQYYKRWRDVFYYGTDSQKCIPENVIGT